MALEANPKQWMQRNTTKTFVAFTKPNTVFKNPGGSDGEPTAAAEAAGPAAELPLTQSDSLTYGSNIENQTTGTPERIQQRLQTRTPPLTPLPYVSPGPYFVEYPHEYHFTTNEPQKCEQEKPFVVLMVQVAPHNRAHRDIIRSTWGSESLVLDKVVKLFFLLGIQTGEDAPQVQEQVLQESAEHRDLIQSDFIDCYKNLTIKTMVMLEWLNSYCSTAAYAMKIDSDMFLNVHNLVKILLDAPKTNFMAGLVQYNAAVLRDPGSKWYVPMEVLPEPVYPPYALGMGYILSLDLTTKLTEASRHVKAIYIEDVYLGLCLHHLGIPPINPPGDFYFSLYPVRYSPCEYSKIVATTTESFMDRVWLWKNFKTRSKYC